MGVAIANQLLGEGHSVTVWNRTATRAEPFVGRAVIAADAAAAVVGADLTVVSTLDNRAAHGILSDAQHAVSGALVVNLSSDTPRSAHALSAWAREHDCRYLSGVMLTPSTIVGQPGSSMLVAGADADINEAMPALAAIAQNVTLLGHRHELPASFDTALLGVFWTTLAAWAHGTALAKAHGISGESIAPQLTSMVRLAAEIGPGFARDADNRNYLAETSTIFSAVTTMEHVTTASNDVGVSSSLPTAVTALYDQAARGHEHESPSRVIEAM